MKPEHSALRELVTDLRWRTKLSQQKLAEAAHISRDTVARYEGGKTNPPVGYVAFLSRTLHQRSSRAREEREVTQTLLRQANEAIILYYGQEESLASWDELCAIADEWLEENRRKRQLPEAPRGIAAPAAEADISTTLTRGSLRPSRWQLRAASPDFVGREAERERLLGALRGNGSGGRGGGVAAIRGLAAPGPLASVRGAECTRRSRGRTWQQSRGATVVQAGHSTRGAV